MNDTPSIDYHLVTQAQVKLRDEVVGYLIKRAEQSYSFCYREDYVERSHALPIAHTFPLRREEFRSKVLHPFFDNMVLEGWLLSQAEKQLHIAKDNRFAMLMAVGRHTIGAVSVVPLNAQGQELPDLAEAHSSATSQALELQPMASPYADACPSCLLPRPRGEWHPKCRQNLWGTGKQLSIALDGVDPFASFSSTIHGGSISGAQRKGLFRFDRSHAVLLPGAAASTHILKPSGDFPELPENEHLTMAIAKQLQFNVPPFALIKLKPAVGLIFVIKRFDRSVAGNLLMEDAAQLLGFAAENKYAGSNERIAGAIADIGSKLDLNDFFRRLIFCFLTGNGDMHLKNWALLEDSALNGSMRLSPCYDLLNTRLALPRESIDIGVPVLGKSRNLKGVYFRKFAQTMLQIVPHYVESVFNELAEWHLTITDFVARSALKPESKARYLQIVAERLSALTAL